MGLKVLMIGPYPLEPGIIHGGPESATSVLVPALAAQDDIDNVAVSVSMTVRRRPTTGEPARRSRSITCVARTGFVRHRVVPERSQGAQVGRSVEARYRARPRARLVGRHCREMQPELRSYRARSAICHSG